MQNQITERNISNGVLKLQRMKTLFIFDLSRVFSSYQVQSNFSFSKVVCVSSDSDQNCQILMSITKLCSLTMLIFSQSLSLTLLIFFSRRGTGEEDERTKGLNGGQRGRRVQRGQISAYRFDPSGRSGRVKIYIGCVSLYVLNTYKHILTSCFGRTGILK